MTKIKEIFASVQGEGPYVGYKQVFVRFCNCNLKCNYCDTEFAPNEPFEDFTPQELADYIKRISNFHSISLTGGEPLLSIDFLKQFLPLVNKYKIYLETNATLSEKLSEVIDFIDIVSADIKLESATGIKDTYKFHDNFFKVAVQKECFAKIVFNNDITEDEIQECCELAKKYNLELILQPQMINDKPSVSADFCETILDKFLQHHENTRLIPQTHKFLNIR